MYARLISVLFYMFFTCVILNPQVNGFTIYFYLLIPFLDPEFSRFLASTVRRWSGPLFIAVVASALGSPSSALRVLSIAICIGYLMYTIERRISYLHQWMAINILFAMVQFVTYYLDYGLSIQLGPTNLSRLIWGQYATETYTNFFEIFYFARVSGFSREAGFFSSLLVTAFIAYLFTESPKKMMIALYLIGLFISFSKSSMAFFIFAGLYPFRNQLRAVHPLAMLVLYIGVVCPLSVYLASNDFFGSVTVGHRFGGYAFMFDARLDDIIKGISGHDAVLRYKYLPYIALNQYDINFASFCGLVNTVTEMGLFAALILFGVLAFTASDGFVMLMLLMNTATVSLTTVTSFVPLAYLICYWPRFSAYIGWRPAAVRVRNVPTPDPWLARPRGADPRLALGSDRPDV
jgi:hypothetical protein